jgi:hypothetical protein
VHSESIPLAGADIRQIAVPAQCGHLRQIDARFLTATVVEEAELDALGRL